jgi:IS30 family transposase
MLHQLGWSTRAIGRKLGRHHSTIARELKRNDFGTSYSPEASQSAYQKRRERSRPKGKRTAELVKEIEEKLAQTWSPEQISERRKMESIRAFRLRRFTAGFTKSYLLKVLRTKENDAVR